MPNLGQTKSVADTITLLVLSNLGHIVPIVKTVGQLMDRAVNDHRLCGIGAASTIAADPNLFIGHTPLHLKIPWRIPSDPESYEKLLCSRCDQFGSSHLSQHETSVSEVLSPISDIGCGTFSGCKSSQNRYWVDKRRPAFCIHRTSLSLALTCHFIQVHGSILVQLSLL